MGNNLFGADIAGALASALGSSLLPAKLIKLVVTPNPLPGRPDTETETEYPARGFIDTYDTREIDGTRVKQSDRKISLLGDTIDGLQVPEPGDKITIEGVTYEITSGGVNRDPDKALYECQCRQ